MNLTLKTNNSRSPKQPNLLIEIKQFDNQSKL